MKGIPVRYEVRRVTMQERDSQSVESNPAVQTTVVESMTLGPSTLWPVWGWDEAPTLPIQSMGAGYEPRSFFPPVGGLRVWANHKVGDSESADARVEGLSRFEALLAAEGQGMVRDSLVPGRHRSDTIDIGVVVSGEVTVDGEDGTQATLRAGDVYIQNGGFHTWRETAGTDAHIVFVLVGVLRSSAVAVNASPDAPRT